MMMMMAHSSQTRIVRTVDGQFLRMIGMLLALSVSCIFPLRLHVHASLSQTHNWLSSLMNASCLGLKPPAAVTDG